MRLINTHAPIAATYTESHADSISTRSVNRIMTVFTAFVLLGAISLSVIVLIKHNRSQSAITQGIDHQQQRLLEQRP